MQRFAFDDRHPLATPLMIAGITARTSYVDVGDGEFLARFGPWVVRTPISNIADTEVTGPYHWWTALGVRLSLSDRGITFGSSTHHGLCLSFAQPVPGLLPLSGVRHPSLTVTVADPEALRLALRRR